MTVSSEYVTEEMLSDEYLESLIGAPDTSSDALTHSFNYGTASMFAKLSASAYCITHNAQSVANWRCNMCRASGVGLSRISTFNVGSSGLGFYVGYAAGLNRIIVAFRGSANFANWIANLDFGKVNYPCNGCKVHGGFLKVYQSARPSMVNKVSELLKSYPSASVSFTGHSLGGAIAKLAFLDTHNGLFTLTKIGGLLHVESTEVGMNYGIEPLPFASNDLLALGAEQLTIRFNLNKPFYTFGAPRIGNPQFASYFRAAVGADALFRSTHRQDPVPKLPAISMGFAHSTTEVYFPNAGTNTSHQVCSTSNGDDPSCIHKTGIIFSIADHSEYGGIIMTQSPGQC